jgi:type VI secretion system protein ImpE
MCQIFGIDMLTLSARFDSAENLRALVDNTMAHIRKEPARAELRVSLFQLYCVIGDWERALGQLGSAATLDPAAEEMARAYREVIRCEVYRAKVFAGSKAPLFLGEPDSWLGKLLEAMHLNAKGQPQDAAALRNEALSSAPTSAGRIGDQSFEWIADMDSRMGPVLEAIVNGKYYWVPFHHLERVEIEAPVDMRDLVWVPAKLVFTTGGEQVAFLPVRYPGTEASSDESLRLARKTDWQSIDEETYFGIGQRMFATDAGEFALLDTRSIELNPSA